MKRQRGWCLLEVLVVVFVGSAVGLTAASLVQRQQGMSHVLGSYSQGLREMRTALAEMGEDVRAGRDLEAAGWKLMGHRLVRGAHVRATHIAAFEATREGALTTIRLSPMSRAPGAPADATRTLTLRVASRGGA